MKRVSQNANKDYWVRTMEGSRCVEEISYHWAIWWEEGKCAKIFISLFIFPGVNKGNAWKVGKSKSHTFNLHVGYDLTTMQGPSYRSLWCLKLLPHNYIIISKQGIIIKSYTSIMTVAWFCISHYLPLYPWGIFPFFWLNKYLIIGDCWGRLYFKKS